MLTLSQMNSKSATLVQRQVSDKFSLNGFLEGRQPGPSVLL